MGKKVFFWYLVNGNVLAANGVQQTTLTFNNDSDFEWTWLYATATSDGTSGAGGSNANSPTANGFTLLITAGDGRQLSNTDIPQRMWLNPNFNFLIQPIIIPRNDVWTFKFTDISNAANNINFGLGGYKILANS